MMIEKQPTPAPDPLLLPLLQAKGKPETERHLERLLNDADPVIDGILRRKVVASAVLPGGAVQDRQTAEDLRGEVRLRLLTRLNELQDSPTAATIIHFRGFVATTTYHVCDDYLRSKYPQRSSLKKKLVYLLTQRTAQHGLAVWPSDAGERLCGFAVWQDQGRGIHRAERYHQLLHHPQEFFWRALPREHAAHLNPADLLAALFNGVGGPIELNDLVQVVAELWGVKDQPDQLPEPREDDEGGEGPENPLDERPNVWRENVVATEVEQRDHLRWLWSEIRQLPPRQCAALLLNLRDAGGCGVLELLELRGIATLRQVAEVLAMPAEQFAGLLNDLPMEDAAIAQLLGCTRQQVINLRKVARERLERRRKALEKSS